ncbi:hypothetical protein PM082_004148 [Marasmius tenuissimus]|nr:hypothetical protein PM082_004148 [Marasmius tenuissimus]
MARHASGSAARRSARRSYRCGAPEHPIGTIFNNRATLHKYMIHGPLQAGIHGNSQDGTYSVVISGGYEDDEDHGDWFWYTGEGGRNNGRSTQVKDQSWRDKGNRALKRSKRYGNSVRVIRGYIRNSPYGPTKGFRYEGLYTIIETKTVIGKSGYKVCKARFERNKDQAPLPPPRWQVDDDETPDNEPFDNDAPGDKTTDVIEFSSSDSEEDIGSHSYSSSEDSDSKAESDLAMEIVSARRAAPLVTSSMNNIRKRTRDDLDNESEVVRKAPKTSYIDPTCTLPEKSNINGRRALSTLPNFKKNK